MTTARVVATPGTMSGQPRIDGTRMTVTQLLVYMRGGMTVDEISATWPHLPAGWFEAIIEWIDSQAVSDVDYSRQRAARANADAVAAVLDSIPDVQPVPGDEIDDGIEATLATIPAADHVDRHGQRWILQLDPGESDEEFDFDGVCSQSGRVAIGVDELSEADLERIQKSVIEHPEELIAFGSGNVARDLGIPEATTFKWRLARILALETRNNALNAEAVAWLAGEIEPAQIDQLTTGRVRDVDSYDLMRLLAALGYRIRIDLELPVEGRDGAIWIEVPD